MAERLPQFEYKEFQGIVLPESNAVVNPPCVFPPTDPKAGDGVQHAHKGEEPNVEFTGHQFVPSERVKAPTGP